MIADMGKIVVLPSEVSDQIAAGEVVERPASVLKELVDNAIDAGASEIEIRVEEGGITRVEVVDNGVGMDRKDLELSVVRHGTSKLRIIDDLVSIQTMGFRGEALASIAAVSKLKIRSKRDVDLAGYELNIEGGKIVKKIEIGMSQGTGVVVDELFFNVPARKKFLRTSGTEWRYCLEMVEMLALANIEVGFRLWHNNKLVLDLLKNQTEEDRVISFFEINRQEFFQVKYDHVHLKMWGWVGKPQTGREKGARQVLIVNKRVVSDRGVVRSVKQAMGSLLPPRYQVPWILYIKSPGEMVDVNVHPRKEEVRFVNPYAVYNAIAKMIEAAVDSQNMRFVKEEFEIKSDAIGGQSESWKPKDDGIRGWSSASLSVGERSNQISSQQMAGLTSSELDERLFLGNKIMQVNNLYILMEEEKGLVIIDQHAAHERIRYEELMTRARVRATRTIDTLWPVKISLSQYEMEMLKENLELLEKVGLRLEVKETEVEVVSVPMGWEEVNMTRVIKEVLGDLREGDNLDTVGDEQTKILTYISCRTAIKGGQRLTDFGMRELVKKLRQCQLPYTCPHGRPVEILVTWSSLAGMFLRTGM